MIESYLPILVLLAVAVILAIVLNVLARVVGPYRPNATKLRPYESGMDPVGQAKERYSISFYVIAMEFIVFDLEVIFIYPWAVLLRNQELSMTAFWAMMIFIVILFLGLIYTLKKDTLDWKEFEDKLMIKKGL